MSTSLLKFVSTRTHASVRTVAELVKPPVDWGFNKNLTSTSTHKQLGQQVVSCNGCKERQLDTTSGEPAQDLRNGKRILLPEYETPSTTILRILCRRFVLQTTSPRSIRFLRTAVERSLNHLSRRLLIQNIFGIIFTKITKLLSENTYFSTPSGT